MAAKKKRSVRKPIRTRSIWSWAVEHVRPSVNFRPPGPPYRHDDDPPSNLGEWFDYAKDNAEFRISLTFAF